MRRSRLEGVRKNELILRFCEMLSQIKSPNESVEFIKDLLSPAEIEMLAIRLKVAEYLILNWDYQKIRQELKVGFNTIARIKTWLDVSGAGYRKLIERKQKQEKIAKLGEKVVEALDSVDRAIGDSPLSYSWWRRQGGLSQFQNEMAAHWLKTAPSRKQRRFLKVLQEARQKPGLFKKIEQELRVQFEPNLKVKVD